MLKLSNNTWLVFTALCVFTFATALSLVSCKGNTAPVANAGPDQNVATGSLVTLDGSMSSDKDSDTLTYSWSFTSQPAGSLATLSSTTIVNPTFVADKDGTYVISLVVNDGHASSNKDTVTITAVTANIAPIANAGPDQIVTVGSTVTLDGSGSIDVNGEPLTYNWSISLMPDGSLATLSSTTIVNPTFTADKVGTYEVLLIVNDGIVSSPADTLTVTAKPPYPVPDTGQTSSYADTFGEDNDYTINPPSLTENAGNTITDNVSGLMWQKDDDATTRTWDNAVTYCDGLTLASFTDWRLPTDFELLTIADYGSYNPAINTTYFPSTQSSLYWSSSSIAADPLQAWPVNFSYGSTSSNSKANTYYVRCVRGQVQPLLMFTDNTNGTITDNATGLIWQQQDDAVGRTWEQATSYCEGLSLGGHSDWRLPNIKELTSIADVSRYNPAINTTYFPSTRIEYYWTSTTYASNTTLAWRVDFYVGAPGDHLKTGTAYVRCVR